MIEWYLQTPTRSNSPFNRGKNPDQSISTQQLGADDDYELDDIHDDHVEGDQDLNSQYNNESELGIYFSHKWNITRIKFVN